MFSHDDSKRLMKAYMKRVTQNGLDLKDVPSEMRNKPLCLAAVQQNGKAIQHVPDVILDDDIKLAAIKSDCLALLLISEESRSEEFCFHSVRRNGILLGDVPNESRTKRVCVAAVLQNSLAMAHVPDDILIDVIDAVTPEKILSDNYDARRFLPSNYDEVCQTFLFNIRNIVITDDADNIISLCSDYELRDIYLVYANSSKHKGKTIHVDLANVSKLMEELKSYDIANINFVLLGHANNESEELAGMCFEEIASFIKDHDKISSLTLLGCNTAQAEKLNKEKKMIRKFASTYQAKKSGLMFMSHFPAEEHCADLLSRVNLDSTFVVVESQKDSQYYLVFIENERMQTCLLDQAKVNNLENFLNHGNRLKFPKEVGRINIFRDKIKPLSQQELQQFLDVRDNAIKFTKLHPEYKMDKKIYPFLRNITIDKTELDKLKPSLFKKLIRTLEESGFNRELIVKGYLKFLHVDTQEKCMQLTKTYLYREKKYHHCRFYEDEDVINRKKLLDERRNDINQMIKGNVTGDSIVKSIKYVVAV